MDKEKNKIKITTYDDDYDDGNIPAIDLPQTTDVIPLPDTDNRPRKDGPGGD